MKTLSSPVVGLAALLWVAAAPPVHAQFCQSMLSSTLLDTRSTCSSIDTINRAFGSQLLRWNGSQFLVGNIGNEMKIWRIDSAASPIGVDSSYYNVANVGDSDYDLLNFSVCDDCRWGVASYKAGTLLFDLGLGSQPEFNELAHDFYSYADLVNGAFTFTRGGHQYLIASDLPDECPSGDSTLYLITGTSAAGLDRVGCVTAPGVNTTAIVGGLVVGDYLYLGDTTTRVFVMRMVDDLGSLSLDHVSTPMLAYMIRDKGLAVDTTAGIAVSANNSGMTVWDIVDPGNPVALSNLPGTFNRAVLSCHYAMVARKGFKFSEQSFDISNPTAPQPVDVDFWGPGNWWNFDDNLCTEVQGATVSPDGSIMYLSRYGVMQMVNLSGCDPCGSTDVLFTDGFESGGVGRWDYSVGVPIQP